MHKGLTSDELSQLAASDSLINSQFQGVFPSDIVPKIEQYPAGFIFNNEPSTEAGMHWLAFYFPEKGQSEFFDSYGFPPEFYTPNFTKLIKNTTRHINTKTLQSLDTAVCGDYSLFYLWHRVRGNSIEKIDQLFANNTHFNDKMAVAFVRTHMYIKDANLKAMCKQDSKIKAQVHHHIEYQEGGALARHRLRPIDKAGYIASMFLSGPAPSFAAAAGKLGGQVLKGITDNV